MGGLISVAVAFAAGFSIGVDYGNQHDNPWRELRTSAGELLVVTYRLTRGGPKAPGKAIKVDACTVEGPTQA